jgi:hypothetical protein
MAGAAGQKHIGNLWFAWTHKLAEYAPSSLAFFLRPEKGLKKLICTEPCGQPFALCALAQVVHTNPNVLSAPKRTQNLFSSHHPGQKIPMMDAQKCRNVSLLIDS